LEIGTTKIADAKKNQKKIQNSKTMRPVLCLLFLLCPALLLAQGLFLFSSPSCRSHLLARNVASPVKISAPRRRWNPFEKEKLK